ncbi:MAG: hypothetical protein GF390_01500 [Candidatus Pacebacteria bacterium]|nr:hypothetical protein [Candidatus Paceibacterota bacterium]
MKYKVLQYFEWGRLKLEKGQIIIIENNSDGTATVSIKHYPDKSQTVSSQAVDSMVNLKRIKKY